MEVTLLHHLVVWCEALLSNGNLLLETPPQESGSTNGDEQATPLKNSPRLTRSERFLGNTPLPPAPHYKPSPNSAGNPDEEFYGEGFYNPRFDMAGSTRLAMSWRDHKPKKEGHDANLVAFDDGGDGEDHSEDEGKDGGKDGGKDEGKVEVKYATFRSTRRPKV